MFRAKSIVRAVAVALSLVLGLMADVEKIRIRIR